MSDTAHTDIGHDMTAALRLAEGLSRYGVDDGEVVGALITHACNNRGSERVEDYIPVEPKLATGSCWNLTSRDPITLTPSIAYRCCGLHGFLTDGKWVPA